MEHGCGHIVYLFVRAGYLIAGFIIDVIFNREGLVSKKSQKVLLVTNEAQQANLVGRGMPGLAGVGLNSRVFWLLFNDRKSNIDCSDHFNFILHFHLNRI